MSAVFAWLARPERLYMVAVLFVGIAVLRIVGTYGVYNATWDEPAHLACGMELVQLGSYTYEPQHPPLARVAVALGPYLDGIRGFTPRLKSMWNEGLDLLYRDGRYYRTLSLARLGVLPFFLFGAVLMWRWGRKTFDRPTAIVAVLLYTLLPPVLAHAGLATTDMAVTAMLLAALMAYVAWLEKPSLERGALLGLAAALALMTKFSAVVFLPACGVAVLTLRWAVERREWGRVLGIGRTGLWSVAIAAVVAFVVCWASYGFSLGPLAFPRVAEPGVLARVAALPIYPLSEMVQGVRAVAEHNAEGHPSYMFGNVGESGWWYYFPVAFVFRTPLGLLVLAVIGTALVLRRTRQEGDWVVAVPPLCAVVVMLVSLTSNINIGIRHVLIVYPLLAFPAAYGAVQWLRFGRAVQRVAAGGLLLWIMGSSAAAHPDYLPYFNELAGAEPERILIYGDLDWGQDLQRLGAAVEELGVEDVAVAYSGSAVPTLHLPAQASRLEAHQETTGWIAVSMWRLVYDGTEVPPHDGFAWLRRHEPEMRVGRSILLYHLP
jgi:4-amino-4-deoxy-L-arabinose transferase-like glycosyltransferase